MKRLEALISPDLAAQVQELLEDRQISEFTFSSVVAKRAYHTSRRVYREQAYEVKFHEELKLEAVVRDDQAMDTAYAILKAAGGPGASCKPRVLLAPVNQVIVQLDEVGAHANQPITGLEQPVDRAETASCRIAIPAEPRSKKQPALSALVKLVRSLTERPPEAAANESSHLASPTPPDRSRRRPWLPSPWLAHRRAATS